MRHSQMSFVWSFAVVVATLTAPNSNLFAAARLLPDISGAYYFVEKPPKTFGDVNWIALFSVDASGREVPLNGFIRLKDRYRGRLVNFLLVDPSLKGNTLTFSTKVVRGISYKFKGQFLKLENFQDGEIVLSGLLAKFRNGRKVAEFGTRYSYFAGD